MPEPVLLDNDVVLKASCYDLGDDAIAVTGTAGRPPAMLGVGRFVVRGRLRRGRGIADPAGAAASFERMLRALSLVEPDDAELADAAELEAEATRRGLDLDGGESQLLAILAHRGGRALVTGDKRAVRAMAVVAGPRASGRIVCLEQLMARLVRVRGAGAVRARVCAEAAVDRALSACFGCASDCADDADVLDALASYVRHLEAEAPGILVQDEDLTAMTA